MLKHLKMYILTARMPQMAFYLQCAEGVVLESGDLVSCEVEDAQVVQAAEHVSCDQVDAVPVERQLQKQTQVSEGPGLQRGDAVILQVEVVQLTEVR